MKGARWLAWPVLLVFLMLGPAMGAEEQSPQEQPSNDQQSVAISQPMTTVSR